LRQSPERAQKAVQGIFYLCYALEAMDDELQHKMRFAQLLQREPKQNRFAVAPSVAKAVLGKDAELYPMFALRISEQWPFDPDVIAELDRLDSIPPPKEVALRDLFEIAAGKYNEKKDRIAAWKLYGEMNGWLRTEKESGGTGTNELLIKLQQAAINHVDT
jgi:hypothetical protein